MSSRLYSDIVTKLFDKDRKGIFLGLDSTREALKRLGYPHRAFPSVLVAGTNGKGSTVTMLSSVLKAAGYRVGTFISPHLLDIRERLQINQRPISKTKLGETYRRVQRMDDGLKTHLSFFEFITVMAFSFFAQEEVDIAIVEVGLGGRLDATNVLNPLVSVITTIGLDHQRFLGNTLTKIAFEKAGIMRSGRGVVLGESRRKPLQELLRQAKKKGAIPYRMGSDFTVQRSRKGFTFKTPGGSISDVRLALQGDFQQKNAGCVLQVISLLRESGWKISETAVRKGLLKTRWPGRLELVKTRPHVILDAAHNMQGMRALFKSLKQAYHYNHLHLVMGVMKDKNYRTIMEYALDFSDNVYFVEPAVHRALKGDVLKRCMPNAKRKIVFYDSVERSLPHIIKNAQPNDMICVTGSIYTISEAKRFFQ